MPWNGAEYFHQHVSPEWLMECTLRFLLDDNFSVSTCCMTKQSVHCLFSSHSSHWNTVFCGVDVTNDASLSFFSSFSLQCSSPRLVKLSVFTFCSSCLWGHNLLWHFFPYLHISVTTFKNLQPSFSYGHLLPLLKYWQDWTNCLVCIFACFFSLHFSTKVLSHWLHWTFSRLSWTSLKCCSKSKNLLNSLSHEFHLILLSMSDLCLSSLVTLSIIFYSVDSIFGLIRSILCSRTCKASEFSSLFFFKINMSSEFLTMISKLNLIDFWKFCKIKLHLELGRPSAWEDFYLKMKIFRTSHICFSFIGSPSCLNLYCPEKYWIIQPNSGKSCYCFPPSLIC